MKKFNEKDFWILFRRYDAILTGTKEEVLTKAEELDYPYRKNEERQTITLLTQI